MKLALSKQHALLTTNIEKAIPVLRTEWTSMPGAKQSKMTMTQARALFDRYVTELSKE